MSKHTPGPWRVHKPRREMRCNMTRKDGTRYGDSGIEILAECKKGGFNVIVGSENCRPWERILNEANAHLIAAAPELLEACKQALRDLGADDGDDTECGLCGGRPDNNLPYHEKCSCFPLRAIIAKAEGGA